MRGQAAQVRALALPPGAVPLASLCLALLASTLGAMTRAVKGAERSQVKPEACGRRQRNLQPVLLRQETSQWKSRRKKTTGPPREHEDTPTASIYKPSRPRPRYHPGRRDTLPTGATQRPSQQSSVGGPSGASLGGLLHPIRGPRLLSVCSPAPAQALPACLTGCPPKASTQSSDFCPLCSLPALVISDHHPSSAHAKRRGSA